MIIAIIDEGTATDHPDLDDKIVTPYDATGDDDNQEPNAWDGHGTACAGIAAAETNNGIGIAGVAPNCKILPVRIAYSSQPGGNWITNSTWIARGVRTAVDRGAHVLSNSWGGGLPNNTIRGAFQYAQAQGRGGRGAISISAAGNNFHTSVLYPARYPESLACGASNQWDQRKTPTSRDGENWGSHSGSQLDFLAPGVSIQTTDIPGSGGYRSGDYVSSFNGTSSATPHAAGVAALMVSADGGLRHWEVADILRLTAKDLGTAGRDNNHGWGRIDARKAMEAVRRLWHKFETEVRFLGSGQECYIAFPKIRLYNSGINRVRVNSFRLRSLDSNGDVIDERLLRFDPGPNLSAGLGVGGGSGHDLELSGFVLRAEGNASAGWQYRWAANWGYTYWRPNAPLTTANGPADAAQALSEEDGLEGELEFRFDSAADLADDHADVDERIVTPEMPVPAPANGHDGYLTVKPGGDGAVLRIQVI